MLRAQARKAWVRSCTRARPGAGDPRAERGEAGRTPSHYAAIANDADQAQARVAPGDDPDASDLPSAYSAALRGTGVPDGIAYDPVGRQVFVSTSDPPAR